MLTIFLPCIEEDMISGSREPLIYPNEYFGTIQTDNPPKVGQHVSFGAGERWEIAKLEPFRNEADIVMVAYFKLIDHPTLQVKVASRD